MIFIHKPFFKWPLATIHHLSNFTLAQMVVHSTVLTLASFAKNRVIDEK